jgi:hypothetical protein
MKKLVFLFAIIIGTLTSVNSFAQGKGQVWLGGNANADVALSPDFALTLGADGNYFVMDNLSLGANLSVAMAAGETTTGITPMARYFIGKIFPQVSFQLMPEGGGIGVGVGYWYNLKDNINITPVLNYDMETEAIALNIGFGIKLK